jgi:hypothetical protein
MTAPPKGHPRDADGNLRPSRKCNKLQTALAY